MPEEMTLDDFKANHEDDPEFAFVLSEAFRLLKELAKERNTMMRMCEAETMEELFDIREEWLKEQ